MYNKKKLQDQFHMCSVPENEYKLNLVTILQLRTRSTQA